MTTTTTTTITNILWVLGPADPEMDLLEKLLNTLGGRVVYATGPGGGRLLRTPFPQAGTGVDPVPNLDQGDTVALVGCDGVRLRDALGLTPAEVASGHPGRDFRVLDPVEALREVLNGAGIGIGGDSKVGWYASIPVGL